MLSPLPQIPSPPLPTSPPVPVPSPLPPDSPTHPLGYRAAMIRLTAKALSTSHPLPLPPSGTPPILPIPTLTPSPPMLLPSTDRRADRPEVCLPPQKRMCIALGLRYKVGESSSAATARLTEGRRADYGFEQDTQDIYAVIEDAQDRQTQIYQRVEALVNDRQYHYETARLLDQEAMFFREAWAHSMGLSSTVHYELQGYRTHTWTQDHRIDAQESLIATLTAQVSSIQGHLSTALDEIRALQARDQTRTGAPDGAGSSA
ncbi:hypothetical protein Tco_0653134 [Tanacetum coccineum]|uniref:Uncharacterized protein n=1 Tax=Tanacetum coccineum TaxID=301880 RepID=A0ABQ4WZQ2_9ASTR